MQGLSFYVIVKLARVPPFPYTVTQVSPKFAESFVQVCILRQCILALVAATMGVRML